MIDELVKSGVGTAHEVTFSKEQVERQFGKATTQYPTGNDKPRSLNARGQIESEVGGHGTEEVDVLDPLSERVKTLVESAGGKYIPPVRPFRVTPELGAAFERLLAARPLLAKAVEISLRREYGEATLNALLKTAHHDRSPASIAGDSSDGSASGSTSGSVSGDESVDKYYAIGLAMRAAMQRRRGAKSGSASGSVSGSVSGEESGGVSGSPSGQISKATVIRAQQGFVDDALQLMGRR